MSRHISRLKPHARDCLRKIPRDRAQAILDTLTDLQEGLDKGDLANLDVKKLGEQENKWRLRIGLRYRLTFSLEESPEGSVIWVIDVGMRENFYR